MKSDCLFCRLAAGEIPSEKVFENDRVVAFRDVNPVAPEHILLIPREHVASSMADLDVDRPEVGEIWAELARVARTVAAGPEFAGGWRLVTNTGPDAHQSVFHLHLHLLAGRRFDWPPG
ncbi:MAG: histidine triad nucleotide-binding protein [Actinomycetota bacterium]